MRRTSRVPFHICVMKTVSLRFNPRWRWGKAFSHRQSSVSITRRRARHPLGTPEAHRRYTGCTRDSPVRGYEYCQRGALAHSGRSCRTDGSGVTLRTCWSANPQVGLREMLVGCTWSNSPSMRMSTGAKHLHGDRPAYLSACKRLTRFRPSAQAQYAI